MKTSEESPDSVSYKDFMKEEKQTPPFQEIIQLDLVLSSEELRPLLAVTGEAFSCSLERGTWNDQMVSEDGNVYLSREEVLNTVPNKIAHMHQTLSQALAEYPKNPNLKGVQAADGPWRPGAKPVGFTVEFADLWIQTLELLGALDLEQEFLFALAVKLTYNRETLPKQSI